MIIIHSILRRKHLAELTKKSLMDNGVEESKIKIMFGDDRLDHPLMKRPHLLVSKFFYNEILPYCYKENEDCIYIQDGCIFSSNPLNINFNELKINWLGYLRMHGDYIVGAKFIYIPYNIVKHMILNFPANKNFGRIDRMIRDYGIKHDKLTKEPRLSIELTEYVSDWGNSHKIK